MKTKIIIWIMVVIAGVSLVAEANVDFKNAITAFSKNVSNPFRSKVDKDVYRFYELSKLIAIGDDASINDRIVLYGPEMLDIYKRNISNTEFFARLQRKAEDGGAEIKSAYEFRDGIDSMMSLILVFDAVRTGSKNLESMSKLFKNK